MLIMVLFPALCRASGVQPETSVVIINEAQKGGSINVTNTEKVPVLLYSKVVNLPDDPTPRLSVTQPVARLEPGQSQRVRFVLNSDGPLQREHIKRVYFEGVAAQNDKGSQVNVTVRQDLPVIIIPAALTRERDMWKDLGWSLSGETLKVTNTGRQVVRLVPQLNVLPAGIVLSLSKNYILPGETLSVSAPAGAHLSGQQQVQFSPVTRYGFSVGLQKVSLSKK
ncbi:fimbria/pilus chaperone family protein [Enterobacter hormaechei]